jgi:hypothetical protein
MKFKIGMLFAGLVVAVAAIGVLNPIGMASAEDNPATTGDVDVPYFFTGGASMPHWLRYGIVYCAARTTGLDIDLIKAGLRNGESLKQIAAQAGVRPVVLENGILRCERGVLDGLVDVGELDRLQAARIYTFLETHIARILNFTWDGPSAS